MKKSPEYFKWTLSRTRDGTSFASYQFRVIGVHTSEGTYSTDILIAFKTANGWKKVLLPLWNRTSSNSDLLKLWDENVINGKLRKGVEFTLLTWLDTSTNYTFRKYKINFS